MPETSFCFPVHLASSKAEFASKEAKKTPTYNRERFVYMSTGTWKVNLSRTGYPCLKVKELCGKTSCIACAVSKAWSACTCMHFNQSLFCLHEVFFMNLELYKKEKLTGTIILFRFTGLSTFTPWSTLWALYMLKRQLGTQNLLTSQNQETTCTDLYY